MACYVPFHAALREGRYAGIPRGVRFAWLELCLLARPRRGVIELPWGLSDEDGVCRLLGGDRKEVQRMLAIFSAGPEPSFTFGGEPNHRRITIEHWSDWNRGGERPGTSTKRVRAFRDRQKADRSADETIVSPVSGPLHETAEATGETPLNINTKGNEGDTPSNPRPARASAHVAVPVPSAAQGDLFSEPAGDPEAGRDPGAETSIPATGDGQGRAIGRRRRSQNGTKEPPASKAYETALNAGISSVTNAGTTFADGKGRQLGPIAQAVARRPDGTSIVGEELLVWFRDVGARFATWSRLENRDLSFGVFRAWVDKGCPVSTRQGPGTARTRPGQTMLVEGDGKFGLSDAEAAEMERQRIAAFRASRDGTGGQGQ